MRICDLCGKQKEEENLIKFGQSRICLLCKLNQNRKPRGRVVEGNSRSFF
jgi:hypothetical protein